MATNDKFLHSDITNLVLQAYYKVYNSIGYGFGNSTYVHALSKELTKLGCQFELKKAIDIIYEGEKVGEFSVDLYCATKVIVIITSHELLKNEDLEKLKNQLKHVNVPVGLLLNFGLTPEHKRKMSN
jgi:GxxExxY protein